MAPIETGRQSAVPRLSQTRGYSITVEPEGGYIDRELLQMEMEEYGMVKEMQVGRDRAVVTFYEEDSAHRAWLHLVGFPADMASVGGALSSPDGHRGRLLDVSARSRGERSRSRSQVRHVWFRRRAVSMSPTPRNKESGRFSVETPLNKEMSLRQRSRSLQQLFGSNEDNTMYD